MGMKSNGGFFKGTKGNPVAGDASFMNSNDDFLKYIRKRKDVDPGGKFDLIAHGTANKIELEHNGKKILVNSRTVAKLLKICLATRKASQSDSFHVIQVH